MRTPSRKRGQGCRGQQPRRLGRVSRCGACSCGYLAALWRSGYELCSPSAFVAAATDRNHIKRLGVITMIVSVSRSAAIDARNASVKFCKLAGANSFVNLAETYRAHFSDGFRAIRKAIKRPQITAPDRLSAQKTKGFLGFCILCGEPARRASVSMRVVSLSARLACSPDGLSRVFGAHAATFSLRCAAGSEPKIDGYSRRKYIRRASGMRSALRHCETALTDTSQRSATFVLPPIASTI